VRLGILGGTFDPPHYGHLILAEQAYEQLALEKVLWVPAADPPLKEDEPKTPIAIRLEMLRMAITDNDHFAISLADVERPGPHYTVDMLALLRKHHLQATFFFLMGSDSLNDLLLWREPARLIQMATLAVMARPGAPINLAKLAPTLPGIEQRVIFIDGPQIEIASSDIEARIQSGRSIRYLLPKAIEDYVYEQKLYGLASPGSGSHEA
jgi:nicotinate-nucleotide adenylyltransferase